MVEDRPGTHAPAPLPAPGVTAGRLPLRIPPASPNKTRRGLTSQTEPERRKDRGGAGSPRRASGGGAAGAPLWRSQSGARDWLASSRAGQGRTEPGRCWEGSYEQGASSLGWLVGPFWAAIDTDWESPPNIEPKGPLDWRPGQQKKTELFLAENEERGNREHRKPIKAAPRAGFREGLASWPGVAQPILS